MILGEQARRRHGRVSEALRRDMIAGEGPQRGALEALAAASVRPGASRCCSRSRSLPSICSRSRSAAISLAHQKEAQRICERLDAADIGVHLQPWINQPFDDHIERADPVRASFPGELPAELEHAKLRKLTETIEANLGTRPLVYRAGRYSLGSASFEMLDMLGYEIDASVLPRIDLSAKHGPDFTALGLDPFWFSAGRKRLGIPLALPASSRGTTARSSRW